MANNFTISSSIDELAEIFITEVQEATKNLTDLRNYVNYRPCPAGSESVRFPLLSEHEDDVTTDLVEGNTLGLVEVTTSGVNLAPTVKKSIAGSISYLAKHNAPQVVADAGRTFGKALITGINRAVWATFADATDSIGTTNTDLTWDLILDGVQKMEDRGWLRPTLVVTPYVKKKLLTNLYTSGTGANRLYDDLQARLSRGEMVEIDGVGMVVVNKVAKDGNGDYVCALMDRMAVGYAESWDVNVFFDENIRAQATEIVASTAFATGLVNQNAIVKVIADGGV